MELQQVGRFYTGVLWRDDLLPVPRYLELVVQAHMELDSRLGTDRFYGTCASTPFWAMALILEPI